MKRVELLCEFILHGVPANGQHRKILDCLRHFNCYGIYPIANHRLRSYMYLRQPFEPIAQWVRGLGAIMG